MSISSSFSAALDAVKRNPVLFVATFFVAILGTVLLGAQSSVGSGTSGFVWSAASFLVQLVTLFFVGGAYAMAAEALDGETNIGTLVSAGKEYYVSLLGATLLLVGVTIASFIAVAILAIAVILGGSASLGAGAFGPVVAFTFGIYLLAFVPLFFLQFYGPAVVVSEFGAVDSLKRSYGVVRRNLLATLGFDAVLLALGLLGSAPTVWLYATRFDDMLAAEGDFSLLASLDPSAVAGYLVSTLVLSTLFGGFFYAYQVAFYEDLVDRTETTGGEPTTAAGDASAVGSDL